MESAQKTPLAYFSDIIAHYTVFGIFLAFV